MKNLLISLCLFTSLLIFGLFVWQETTEAQTGILPQLISLPAPPPPNPFLDGSSKRRSAEFYDRFKVPPDDATIEDLLDYWKTQSSSYERLRYNAKPSEKVLERLLEEIEKNPELLVEYINILPPKPEVADFVKRLYDGFISQDNLEKYQQTQIKSWLVYNSNYFSDELLKKAQTVSDTEEYVTNQDELLALARVDWDKARPILENLYNDKSQPVSQTLARWAFYEHALREGNSIEAERYRDELKATVEDGKALPGNRDLSLDALSQTPDFAGRDEWYYTLLEDETLHDLRVDGQSYTGLTTILLYSPPDKYAEKMLELLKTGSPTVRNAVVRNLGVHLNEKNPEIIKALLPWLENPNWAKEYSNERQKLITALQSLTMPESVPGLLAVLNEKRIVEVSQSYPNANLPLMNTNMMVSSNMRAVPTETLPYRYAAIGALAKQKDAQAIPALRQLLNEVQGWEQHGIINALLASGGFPVAEQVEALEYFAKNIPKESMEAPMINRQTDEIEEEAPSPLSITSETKEFVISNTITMTNSSSMQRPINPLETKTILATQIINNPEPNDELVAALIDRINVLDAKEPPTARALRQMIHRWNNAAINSLLLGDLKNGKTDVNAVVKLLSLRKHLREKQYGDVIDARTGNPIALGISACLLEATSEYEAILSGENEEAKTAMLGCARLIRAQLPLKIVAAYLPGSNKLLALAAERYLESEDSPEARQIVLAHHPNEAKILGARLFFETGNFITISSFLPELFASVDDSLLFQPYYMYYGVEEFVDTERKLQKEVRENKELLGIYAYDDNFIRIYKDKAIFSWEEDEARYRERLLTEAEFDYFKNHLGRNRVDEMPPFLSFCEVCEGKELLMLGRQGGRRVFVKTERMPPFFAELDRIFEEMRKPPAKLRYWLEKEITGLEILFADKNLQARAVWKNDDDFRVLIDDVERRKRIDREMQIMPDMEPEDEEFDYEKAEEERQKLYLQKQYENFSWRRFSGKLADLTSQPPMIEYLPVRDGFPVPATNQQWKARTPNFELRADAEGLYKISRGQMTKIRDGFYRKPLVTPDGRWAIVTKWDTENEGYQNSLVRVNLLTNKEFKIKIGEYPVFEAVAFIPSINKTLITAGSYRYHEERESLSGGNYFLLDAETGAIQKTEYEKILPLTHQIFRPLQPTAKPDEFWAVFPGEKKKQTEVGIFNAKTFAFKPLLKIPRIKFDSMNIWVDEKEGKIYFVYEGQLLALPLPKLNEETK